MILTLFGTVDRTVRKRFGATAAGIAVVATAGAFTLLVAGTFWALCWAAGYLQAI